MSLLKLLLVGAGVVLAVVLIHRIIFGASPLDELKSAEQDLRRSIDANTPPLVLRARAGDLDGVREELARTDNVDDVGGPGGIGKSAFAVCAERRDIACLRLLSEAGANLNQDVERVPDERKTALVLAAKKGDLELTKALLSLGADPNYAGEHGETALGAAAEAGSIEVVRALLDAGAAIDLPSLDTWSPLMRAAASGNKETVAYLLESGADIDFRETESREGEGMTAIANATEGGYVEVVRYLADAGADLTLHYYDEADLMDFARATGSVDIVDVLREKGMTESEAW